MAMTQNYRMCLTEARKRHVHIIARLLNDSASKTKLPVPKISAKLPLVAYKMEHRIYELTKGRVLDEKTIQKFLVALIQQAHRRHKRLQQKTIQITTV
ncbi:hypothetical protein THRCLA_20870 [Thraustotheca clavata]|uniref:Uncharacterized protein n=1 Tax=Thraustotheca clavata TaxID=74557 RepID=A0A1W0A2H8_9STRA|nr:hypothetical protein THRCLA_20870 [Thraustotheca clavata]